MANYSVAYLQGLLKDEKDEKKIAKIKKMIATAKAAGDTTNIEKADTRPAGLKAAIAAKSGNWSKVKTLVSKGSQQEDKDRAKMIKDDYEEEIKKYMKKTGVSREKAMEVIKERKK